MKKLILIVGLLISGLSLGADWKYATSVGGEDFYIDQSFYKYNAKNQTIDVWVKTMKKSADGDSYTTSKILTRYSCVEKESKSLASIEYDSNGKTLKSNTQPSSKFELIFPDTVGETILINSCLSKGKGFLWLNSEPKFVDLGKLGYQKPQILKSFK